MPDPIIRGNTLRADLTVRDDLGALADPTTLVLTIKTPGNVTTILTYPTAAIVRVSLGIFYSDIVLTEVGIWEYEWVTTLPDRAEGEQVYVESDPINSPPTVANVADYTRFYLGGQNWNVLANSANFGISYIILGVETVKRRVLTSPPTPAQEYALNGDVLAYLGILSALELIPATMDAWNDKLISRTTGNDPSEITTYTDRAKRIEEYQNLLLRRVPGLKAAALPYLDPVLNVRSSVAAIDEDDDRKVTDDPRAFPPAWSFPYGRDEVIPR